MEGKTVQFFVLRLIFIAIRIRLVIAHSSYNIVNTTKKSYRRTYDDGNGSKNKRHHKPHMLRHNDETNEGKKNNQTIQKKEKKSKKTKTLCIKKIGSN